MPLEIAPFADEHIDEAARLLADRHAVDRVRDPILPARYERADEARAQVQALLADAQTAAVVALQSGRVTGYLAAPVVLTAPATMGAVFVPPRSTRIGIAACATDPEHGRETIRALYAALAPRWLAAGCFYHGVDVYARDRVTLDAWHSLGFGREMTGGVRDTAPATITPARPPDIHEAGAEDIEVVFELVSANLRYHTASPAFSPYFPETEPAWRTYLEQSLVEPARRTFVAYRDGGPRGIQTFMPARVAMSTPERCAYLQHGFTVEAARGDGVATALLDHALAWLREAGYEHCAVTWMNANLQGARFWQRSGFTPLMYHLVRRVDERIAWAGGRTSAEV